MRARIALIAVSLVAIAWLATGWRAARLESRASATVGDRSLAGTTRVNRASSLFERSRRFNPDTRPILLEAGLLLFVDSGRPRALRLIGDVLRREPDNVYAWNLLAQGPAGTNPALVARAKARVRVLSPPVRAAR
jgi:predicted Zn-dependent protease